MDKYKVQITQEALADMEQLYSASDIEYRLKSRSVIAFPARPAGIFAIDFKGFSRPPKPE